MSAGKIEVENVNHPGKIYMVDAAIYALMRAAWLEVLPQDGPALTLEMIVARLGEHLAKEPFVDGAGLGWWSKTVQLDLEAKGIVQRDKGSPIRLKRVVS